MIMTSLPTGPLEVNCYLVGCEDTRKAAVIDPGGNVSTILELLRQHDLTLAMVINTHGHFDHIGANRSLLEKTGCDLLVHQDDAPLLQRAAEHAALFGLSTSRSPEPTRLLKDGDVIELGNLSFKVIHTPGHSPGGICLQVEDCLFVGDTLFSGSIGRTDLPGGNHQQLINNIKNKLLCLAAETRVYPGHGPATTIGLEKHNNPFLAG
ncbi:MBL fold metallo-hydrolase [Pelovirga terrestris]|uniref:MBL fold metallo-hydrolase n=1 Tax=Pelovirga terrestris TaxID=2771352 RepID=A0A8J6QN41_9BACT|nr:MBL fold metallo-hydrolase [Pelovirga terrestris]MBD1399206.1 MBL fold metallo-hydrolase [Pelovirga terrestris]